MFRNAFKYLFKLFLLSLPLTLIPILNGTIGGIAFTVWNARQVDTNVHHFLSEIDMHDRLGDWNVPGALPIHSFMDMNNDFHLTRLSTNTWLSVLGFLLPNEYAFAEDVDAGIDKLADLDHLMRDVSNGNDLPTEQWVYVTEFIMPDFISSDFDQAFDEVIRYSYAHSAMNDSGFAFIECLHTGFLCGVWNVQAPTLLHFMVGDVAPSLEDLDPVITYNTHQDNLRPVTVRVIEFPLEDAFLNLPLNVFPSAYEQMRAVVATPGLYKQFDLYDPSDQLFRRFNDYMVTLWEWKASPFYYFRQTESLSQDYITEPLGIEPYMVELQNLIFTVTSLVSTLVHWPLRFAWDSCKSFLGYPGPAEWMLRDPEEPRLDFMQYMFAEFLQSVMTTGAKFSEPTADSFSARAVGNSAASPIPT